MMQVWTDENESSVDTCGWEGWEGKEHKQEDERHIPCPHET